MLEERTFIGQSPEDLKDEAIADWAQGMRLRITRLDDRIEEVRDDSDDLSNPAMVVKLAGSLTIPYYYRIGVIEKD